MQCTSKNSLLTMDCATTPKKLHPASDWMVSTVLGLFAHDLCACLYRTLVCFVFALGLCSCGIVFLCKGVVPGMCAEAG